jgi:hypothetical protein
MEQNIEKMENIENMENIEKMNNKCVICYEK